jgi:hypothetical protein
MKSMGQRSRACFDLGVTMAMAETHQSRVDSVYSRFIGDVKRNIFAAQAYARNLLYNYKIPLNYEVLLNFFSGDYGTDRIRAISNEHSEQINIFDRHNGTLCGKCHDLGVHVGFGECQASFWDIPPDSDIQASGDLAMSALEDAKPFAESLRNAFPGVSAAGIEWIRQGYSDPDGTGNGFQVLYQRCVQGRELIERSISNVVE